MKGELYAAIRDMIPKLGKLRQVEGAVGELLSCPSISAAQVTELELGTGGASARLEVPRSLFYETLSSQSGFQVESDGDLLELLSRLAEMKAEYDKVAPALRQVWETGYGIVVPRVEELELEQPEIMRQGGRYGVRLKASAPSIHLRRSLPKRGVAKGNWGDGQRNYKMSSIRQIF
jgi:stage IV sporulation protein A